MRKYLILFAMLLTTNVWAELSTVKIGDDTYYQIGSCEDLVEFSNFVNTGSDNNYPNAGANAVLTADIDMSCSENFVPIGAFKNENNVYSGHFKGEGYVVSNLIVKKSNDNADKGADNAYYVGLFGRLKGTVEKVVVYKLSYMAETGVSGVDYVGGIAGYLDGGEIVDCTVAGESLLQGRRNVGGVVGYSMNGSIKDCLSSARLKCTGRGATAYVGGICGYADGKTKLNSCVYMGSLIVRECADGDTCYCDNGKDNTVVCKRDGTVSGTYFPMGSDDYKYARSHQFAIAGGSDGVEIVDCYYMKNINTPTDNNDEVYGDMYWESTSDSSGKSIGDNNVNTSENTCKLNGENWDVSSSQCDGSKSLWVVGEFLLNQDKSATLLLNQEGVATDSLGNLYFAITFNANGGAFDEDAKTVKMLLMDSDVDDVGVSIPSRYGYEFKGWALSEDASVALTSYGKADKRKTFYAVWNFVGFTITYMDGSKVLDFSNNGNNPMIYTEDTDDILLNGLDVKEKSDDSGLKFIGWFKNPDFSGEPVTSIPKGSTGNVTLYAKFKEAFFVMYYINGSQMLNISGWFVPGEPLPKIVPEYEHYFSGWEWSSNENGPLDEEPKIMPNDQIYAVGYADFFVDVVFNANGGTFSDKSNEFYASSYYGISVDLNSFSIPPISREGYRFLGWSRSSDASVVDESLGKIDNSTGVTFYAVWNRTYSVTFDKNGHGTDVESQLVDSSNYASEPVTLTDPEYVFAGWFKDDGTFNEAYDFENTPVKADIELHAKWLPAVTVTINANSSGMYTGELQSVKADVSGLPEGFYLVCDDSIVNVDDSPKDITCDKIFNAEGSDVTDQFGLIFTDDIKTSSFSIEKADKNDVSVSLDGWTYGSEMIFVPEATALFHGKNEPIIEYAKKGSEPIEWSTDVPTAAGEYYVRARVVETTNYVADTAVAEFTIAQRVAEITWNETILRHTGEKLVPTATVTNLVDDDVCLVYVEGGIVDVGSGTAVVSGLSNSNYKLPEEIPSTSFKVIPKVEKEFVVTISPTDFTYTGNAVVPDVVVEDDGKILGVGTDYSVSGLENIIDVGEYEVIIFGMGDYTDSDTVKFTVSPVITVNLAEDENLVCSEGAKGVDACNAAKDNIAHVYGVATTELPDASKSGWTFEGWYDNAGLVNGKIDDEHTGRKVESIVANRTDELNLYPKFTRYITVVYGDGEDDKIQMKIESDDSDDEIIGKIKTTLETEGITPTKTSSETTTYNYNENWEKNASGEYVAQFDSSAREYSVALNVPESAIIHDNIEKYTYGTETDLPKNVSLDGWNFDSWIDSAGNALDAIPDTMIGDVSYSAVFIGKVYVVYGGNADKKLAVDVLSTDADSTCIRKIKDAIEKNNLVDSVKKVGGSADSVYTYDSWQKKLDDEGIPVLDEGYYFVYEPTFEVDVKKDTVIAMYGDDPATDFVEVQVAVTDTEEERIAKIKQSITADIAQNIKKVHEYEDSVYIYDSWQKKMEGENPVLDGNGNVVYEPTFKSSPKVIELSVVYGINPETDVILVEVEATDSEDERIAKIKNAIEANDFVDSVKKAGGSTDSVYTYDSWQKKTDGDGQPVTDENGCFIYEPTFEVQVKTETIVAVYGGDAKKDFIEVEVAVTDSDAKRIEKIKESLEKQGITPSKAEDADSTYAYNGDWKKIKEGFQAEFESNSKYIVVVVDGDSVNVMKSKDEIDSGMGDDAVVEVKVVVDGDTSKVPVSNGDVLEDAVKEVIGENPTKPETADSTYEFIRWEPIVEDGEPVVDENGNSIYEPSFKSEVKKDTILVDAGDGKTMEVVIHVTDDDGKIQNRIIDSFEDSGTPLPKKNSEGDTLYKLDSFVLDEESGIYEPTFKKVIIFPVVFVMPKAGKLLSEFEGYVYGERTKLPEACIMDDDEWEFKGWYTEPNGLGTRVKYMLETDVGKKVFFPLFQKTVTYSINGTKGDIEVIYSKNAEKNILRSLDRVIPEDFRKKNVNFTFDKWELENGIYVAQFVEGQGIRSNVQVNFRVNVAGHALEITGANSGSKVYVFDARGRLVQRAITSVGTLHLNVKNSGRYIVRVDEITVPVDIR